MNHKSYKKWIAVSLSAAMLTGNLSGITMVRAADITNKNLLVNPGFEEDTSGWTFSSGSGVAGNNAHSGSKQFYLDDSNNGIHSIVQRIVIPADGTYQASAWLSSGGTEGKFGIRTEDGETIHEVEVQRGGYQQYTLDEITTVRDTVLEIYVTSGTAWVNGDDFEFICTEQTGETDDTPKYIFDGNMVGNPSFTDNTDWLFSNAGYASNNGHNGRGDRHFYINTRTGKITQQITVPYTGYYKAGLWVGSAGTGATFGVRNVTTGDKTETTLATNTKYSEYNLEIWLNKGDVAEIYVTGGSDWVNGDDISLEYNKSKFVNMTVNPEFSSETGWTGTESVTIEDAKAALAGENDSIRQEIYLPLNGTYYAEITFEDAGNAKVSFAGKESETVNGAQTIRVTAEDLESPGPVELVISGKAVVTKADVQFDLASMPNEAPTASDVTVSGDCTGGLVLESSYTFADEDGHTEGNSMYQWMIADAPDGGYRPLEEETNKNIVVRDAWEDKYLKFQVIPVDQYAKAGEPVLSEAVGPVEVNLIQNPGFESNGSNWSGIGISNSNAFAGLNRGRVAAGGTATQTITVPRTGYYDFSGYVRYPGSEGGVLAVQDMAGNELGSMKVETSEDWMLVESGKVALEEGQQVKIVLTGASDETYDVDNLSLKRDREAGIPAFTNIKAFATAPDAFETVIDTKEKTISLKYLYGTDLTKLHLEKIEVSKGAEVSVKAGDVLDLSKEMIVTVTGSDGAEEAWTILAEEKEKKVALESSNEYLADTFNWAANKMDQFVMTGKKNAPINVPQSSGQTADYIPSYWAGYYDRTAFYTRDFVHQATGAQIAGLADENYSMFSAFAKECTEARQWYTVWALNFDGSVYTMDYNNENSFVREVPAQFELVEKAYKQYLWSGDERYIRDESLWNFYTNVMTNYIDIHDANGNGVAQEVGTGIFQGSCTYNERGGRRVIEAGDAIGSQYQAMLAYAGMLKARGEEEASEEWYQKAAELKKYFNEEWSVADEMESEYVCAWGPNGEKYSDFSKETSWFMPLKLITEPGERNDAYIDFILENLGEGIGTSSTAPSNIEAYTYIPDMLFPYNRSDDAWKWMKYITSIKDEPHERPIQGTNGDYPEISFTFVSHTIEGMMGVEPDAGEHFIATSPRLPSEVPDAKAKYMQIGDYELDLEHSSNTASKLTNHSDKDITWEARFYGEHKFIEADGQVLEAQTKEINGETVSYVTVTVAAGETVSAAVKDQVEKLPFKDVDEDAGSWYYNEVCYVYQKQLMTGLEETIFGPAEDLPRAQMAAILHRLENMQDVTSENPFTDVEEGLWYTDAVLWANEAKIITGYENSKMFGPADILTREQMAVVMYRYAKYKGYDVSEKADLSNYKDASSVSAFAEEAMEWAVGTGIIVGKSDKTMLAPQETINRAECAVILTRFLSNMETK